jgi:hypothetical protein
MHDAFFALQEPIDFLRGTVSFWYKQSRVGWNFQSIDLSNVEEVGALRRKCQAGQEEILAMLFDVETPLDEQRKRCAAIVEECVALTRPHLEGDRSWLSHQDRKERAKSKAS